MRAWLTIATAAFCFGLLAFPARIAAATVTGAAAEPSIVWISDRSVVADTETAMHNENREFVPDMIVIRAGTSVRFPNDDPFFHSIYSSSPTDPFDIGYYGFGPGKLVEFPHAGVVDVRCHIHARMRGTIVVTDGPSSGGFVTQFKLDGVLAGTHQLYFWNSRAGLKSVTVNVPAGPITANIGALR
jgi:plastocyanin